MSHFGAAVEGPYFLQRPLLDDAHAHTKGPVIIGRQGEPVQAITSHRGNLHTGHTAGQPLSISCTNACMSGRFHCFHFT